jgi:hypothetical protein
MTQKYLIGLTLIIVVALLSCGKDKEKPSTTQPTAFEYPLNEGNTWNYHRTVIIEYFNVLDSNTITGRDTIESDYLIQNEIIEVLNDSITAYRLKSTNLTSGVISLEYCKNNSQGLYCYAYELNDGAEPFAKNINDQILLYNFDNPIITNLLGNKESMTDTLIFENPPAKIILYPIIYNQKWTLRTNNVMTVYKEIIGNENITINQVNHNCYKIKYSYSSSIGDNIDLVDYISVVGLVRRSVFVSNIIMTDVNGDTTDNRCNISEETKLTNYMLN